MRWGAHIGIIAAIVLSLVGLSIVVVMAARDARTTAAEVRESSAIWNAYQQARYSVVQEALLTQEYRLAASPEYEEQFGEAAADLAAALETVERDRQGGRSWHCSSGADDERRAHRLGPRPGRRDQRGRRGPCRTNCNGASGTVVRILDLDRRPRCASHRADSRADWSPPSARRP